MINPFTSAVTVDESLHETMQESQEGQWSVTVRPPEATTEDPRETAAKLFRDIHGKYESLSFEIHQLKSGEIEFHLGVEDRPAAKRLMTHVTSAIDGAETEVVAASLPIETGDVIAGTRIEYEEDFLLPLQTQKSPTATSDDPYRAFLDTMADEYGQRAVLQIVATPVSERWTRRWARGVPAGVLPRSRFDRWRTIPRKLNLIVGVGFCGLLGAGWIGVWYFIHRYASLSGIWAGIATVGLRVALVMLVLLFVGLVYASLLGRGIGPRQRSTSTVADSIRENHFGEGRASRNDRQAADNVMDQGKTASYRVNARLLTISDTAGSAIEYQTKLGGHLRNAYHNPSTRQGIDGVTIGWLWSRRLRSFLTTVAGRHVTRTNWQWVNKLLFRANRCRPMYTDLDSLAALAHWPGKSSGGKAAISYALADESDPLPAGDEGYQSVEAQSEPRAALNANPTADTGSADEKTTTDAPDPTVEADGGGSADEENEESDKSSDSPSPAPETNTGNASN